MSIVERPAKSAAKLPVPKRGRLRDKLLCLSLAIIVGVTSATVFYFGLGFFAFGVAHTFPDTALTLYFAVWLIGTPAIAILTGWLTYRKARKALAEKRARVMYSG